MSKASMELMDQYVNYQTGDNRPGNSKTDDLKMAVILNSNTKEISSSYQLTSGWYEDTEMSRTKKKNVINFFDN